MNYLGKLQSPLVFILKASRDETILPKDIPAFFVLIESSHTQRLIN